MVVETGGEAGMVNVTFVGLHSVNEISSSPKSFPNPVVFLFIIQIFAVVFAPEFQVVQNWIQVYNPLGALKGLASCVPLIENWRSAGLFVCIEATQVENT